MALPVIPKDLYPIVPQALGVPALLRNATSIADAATFGQLGIGDALDNLIGAEESEWGLFTLEGKPVAIADSILGVEYRSSARVSDYPVEKGSFASYNKVREAFEGSIRMACGGTLENRNNFILDLQFAKDSLDLFVVVTPEANYENCTIESFDYAKENRNGANMVIATVRVREIRETASAAYSEPKGLVTVGDPIMDGKAPSSSSLVSLGIIQAKSAATYPSGSSLLGTGFAISEIR